MEDIREGIAERIHLEWCDWSLDISEKEQLSEERIKRWKKYWVEYAELPEDVKEQDRIWADGILLYLHSQGAVRKVDRELPTINVAQGVIDWETPGAKGYLAAQQDMLKAGYVATKPLIEEVL